MPARSEENTDKPAQLDAPHRCDWCGEEPLYVSYHDREWGVPLHDEQRLFEMLCLEGAQAGLSWLTILRKREGYRLAFLDFDIEAVSRFGPAEIERLLNDSGIVRNRLKIASVISNAQALLRLRQAFGSLDDYLWQWVEGQPIQNRWQSSAQLPAKTALSDALSKDLKKRGFSFVGSTVCYAFMQSVGMVNDHLTGCYRWAELSRKP